MKTVLKTLAALAGLTLAGGCTTEGDVSGRALFTDNCAVCHGRKADGNGPLADKLEIRPANLSELALNNGGVFPADDTIAKVHGYSNSDHFADMPEFGSVFTGPEVMWETADGARIPTTQNMVSLVRYLESLQVSE